MATILAILRFLLPILVIFFIWRFLVPRMRPSQQQQSSRIDVDARVVNSEQRKVDLEDYEASEVFVKKQPYEQDDTDTKEQ